MLGGGEGDLCTALVDQTPKSATLNMEAAVSQAEMM
jgi:hypothetical protein